MQQQIPEPIREVIESIHMPSIPNVLLRFLSVVDDGRTSMTDLAALVGQDPALSARFLTVANSPALRREAEISSLDQCMVTLGTQLARTLAACLAIQSVFSRASGELHYDFRGFWGHSLRVAAMARAIAVKMNYPDVEEAYLSGLLHDVGQLLLLGGMSERYEDLLRWSSDETVLQDIEKQILSTDHSAVGAWLIDQWKLSSFMSDAVLFHHKTPGEIVDADPLSQIVWSSHVVSNYSEKLDLAQKELMPDLATVKLMTGFDMNDLVAIRKQSSEQVSMLAAALGITEAADVKTRVSPFVPFESYRPKQNDYDPAYSQMEAMVRDMAMMQSLQQNLSALNNETEILVAVRESARILFGLGRIAFLMVNPEKNILSGPHIGGQPPLLQRLEIRLDPGNSLAASIAMGERACSTFDDARPFRVSLVDVQIARALDCEGLLYVPMCVRGRCIGVMAYGMNASQHARIQPRLEWMTSFAHLAAASIETWREMQEHEQKLEANLMVRFEQQARKVVHEAGNPLSIIKNYLKIVIQKLPEENGVRQELDILREEIDRVTHILQRLSDLTEASPSTATADVNSVIEGMLALYSESLFLSHGIAVERTLAPSLPPIAGDRDSVKQILFNLWKNAAEAMPGGGRFSISTRDNVNQNGCLYVEIRLTDSGHGMPPDVMHRLFQPLEPNRRPGHAGIGLSIVASLVERLGGQITCQSNAGQGTCFIILLPQSRVDQK